LKIEIIRSLSVASVVLFICRLVNYNNLYNINKKELKINKLTIPTGDINQSYSGEAARSLGKASSLGSSWVFYKV